VNPPSAPSEGDGPSTESNEQRPCVLFVDDEEAVRRLGARALRNAGFDVLLAADGVEAVECFKAHTERIGVVVMDMTMPRMTGGAAAEIMHGLRPEIPLVLSTGFSCDDTASELVGVAATLQKPYRINTLIETVRQVLARP
jgi:two-component system, cell cycle sensor histidine kinase and response regulator CckA